LGIAYLNGMPRVRRSEASTSPVRLRLEDITLPVGKVIRAYYGFRYRRIRRMLIPAEIAHDSEMKSPAIPI
jgi:hypothetical protein